MTTPTEAECGHIGQRWVCSRPPLHGGLHWYELRDTPDMLPAEAALANCLADAAVRCASEHGARYPEHSCITCAPWLATLRLTGKIQ